MFCEFTFGNLNLADIIFGLKDRTLRQFLSVDMDGDRGVIG